MNKYIGIGVIVVGLGLLFSSTLLGEDKQINKENEPVASAISVLEGDYDFGEIDIFGGKVSTTYTLKNNGVEDVYITKAATSCMCTEGEIGGMIFGMHGKEDKVVIIPAGEEVVLTATFDPLAHGPDGTGKITRELMLKTNSTETPEIDFKFKGEVVKYN